ncbi:M24 family metallopeptidase [Acinetobacter baumannii]|uniref:M24 family metallopeptidase n=1 Tax=Acinetobacter baumannii TaxID=470 RepID=UPI0019D3036A|nr:Xaa-Pro peptidase family protein [Acinetobacter baumannii]
MKNMKLHQNRIGNRHPEHLNMHQIGPGDLAISEWQQAGLTLPNLDRMHQYRLNRICALLKQQGLAGILLYDPINIRYATGTTNMQVWLLHNAGRYTYISAEGQVILWEFDHCDFLAEHSKVVTQIRPCISWFYLCAGSRIDEQVKKWANEIYDVVLQFGKGNKRIAIDKCNDEGIKELEHLGLSIVNGEVIMELARAIKGEDEINAMRCAVHATDSAIKVMHDHLEPGVSEQRLWSYLHAENIARGGEWIETRLLSSGPRCNPWYQECSGRIIQNGELVGFDTDMIGAYGICVDTSRTWLCGDETPTDEQKRIYQMAYDQIHFNTELLRAGITYKELTHEALQYDPNEYNHYSFLYHGVGLCDEAPGIYFKEAWDSYGYDGVLEPGMVMCVESYVGHKAGGPGVKLENQILITEKSPEVLTLYPFETKLLSN